jgi:hypothetical protein
MCLNQGLHTKSYFKTIDPVGFGLGSALGIIKPQQQQQAAIPDPTAERRAAEAQATATANERLLVDARRKRRQKGLLAVGDEGGGSALATGAPSANSSVLGSGGSY